MSETVTKTLDWIGIKKCLDKQRICDQLKEYEKKINDH